MSDPDIRQLQIDLLFLGHNPGTIDGLWGKKTDAALTAYCKARNIDVNLPALHDHVHDEAEAKRVLQVPLPPKYLDLSERCTLKSWRRCFTCKKKVCKCKGGPSERPFTAIRGATLHQWGAPAVDAPERHLGLKAHYSITRSGHIYRIHPETSFGWHAQQLSIHQVGIEIVGLFCGVEGDASTRPGAPANWGTQSITPEQVEATKELLRYLKRLVEAHGGRFTELNAHRQAAPKDSPKQRRRPDPGSKAWKEIAPSMMAELGLSDGGAGFTLGKGEPLPDVWTGQNNGIKY
jgi:hypothetical protein